MTGHDSATGEVLTFKHPAVQSAFMFLGESAQCLVALLHPHRGSLHCLCQPVKGDGQTVCCHH